MNAITVCLICIGVLYIMRQQEFNMRKLSLASIDTSFERNLTSVLDELPDGIIIANKDSL